ncbi:MAG: substrate-binding domain-containing protein [Coriobacteriia bacterium]|nr:substrate-binding domain-containing protein [Coriobacteriia bacterium]MBN2822882.1 substrate-binding domain-containing protein [Coriobacteriia bacterium]
MSFALPALLTLSMLGGCTPAADSVSPAGDTVGEQLRVSGSGTCLPLIQILTDEYTSDSEFVFLPGLHSGGGIKGVANADLEIGAVSRSLSDDEAALGLEYTLLSSDGLVLATHSSVTIDGLSTEQVRDIYSGVYSNWSELGGPDLPITILDRNEDESAKIILRQYVLGPDLEITPKAVNLYYEPDMIEGLQSTAGSIGYFSLGYGLSQDVPVLYMKLDGISATVENIENGTYKVVRPLGVVTAEDASDEITAFLQWATSAEARDLMKSQGFAPAK